MTTTKYCGAPLGSPLAQALKLEGETLSFTGRIQSISTTRQVPAKDGTIQEARESFHFVAVEKLLDYEVEEGRLVRIRFSATSLLHRALIFAWPRAQAEDDRVVNEADLLLG
ncbi:MAG: hypothetical protein UY50_C0002G0014 [Parcubacteria group bacterium GW2011_GWA2_49_9]|nr:MAG: hypothetical protein UY50_C0002G0014 [Parcubacteria group bacterium GW2011_GWA2_49_9]